MTFVPSTSSSTSSSSTSGIGLNTSGSGALQITGLASGLNTDQIIDELMEIKEQPVNALQKQVTGIQARDTQLSTLQTSLQNVQNDVLNLEDPALFGTTQSVASSDAGTVGATATSSQDAGVGGYQVQVTQLASSAQRTFTYASPTSSDTITIDNHSTTITAGESISAFVNSINRDPNATVYAAATSSGSVVFSDRTTGDTGTGYINVQDSGGALTEQTSKAKPGQDAEYSIDGTSGSSSSNTVTDAIAGVTLSLGGLTASSGPVTVTVGDPQPDVNTVATAIQQFVTDYNAAITSIQTQLATVPSSSDPTVGTLYQDPDLQDTLRSMRTLMYRSGSGLPSGLASMLDLGVSTGDTTGSGAVSSSSLAGDLTFNASTLAAQLSANPSGVQKVLVSWASTMGGELSQQAGLGGDIANRITEDGSQVSNLDTQISSMQESLAEEQNTLTAQYASLESALSKNQSETSWLTSQIAALPGAS